MNKVIWPERISLKYWAACLVADFPNESLPILRHEDDFEKWGNIVAGTGVFARSGVPKTNVIKTNDKDTKWIKWAKIVYIIMADEYNKDKQNIL